MTSKRIRFPRETLEKIDAAARSRGITRNHFIIEACERAVAEDAGEWPSGLFELELPNEDLELMRREGRKLEQDAIRGRRNR